MCEDLVIWVYRRWETWNGKATDEVRAAQQMGRWSGGLYALFVVAVGAFIVDLASDETASDAYYTALAALYPLLLIAFFVDAPVSLTAALRRHPWSDDATTEEREAVAGAFVSQMIGKVFAAAVLGTAAALGALADENPDTFTFGVATIALFVVVPQLYQAHVERYERMFTPSEAEQQESGQQDPP